MNGLPTCARTIFPKASRLSVRRWRPTVSLASLARYADRRSSASATPTTKPTIAPPAKPAVCCWRTVLFPVYWAKIFPRRWKNWKLNCDLGRTQKCACWRAIGALQPQRHACQLITPGGNCTQIQPFQNPYSLRQQGDVCRHQIIVVSPY